jgi:hypothetical protein
MPSTFAQLYDAVTHRIAERRTLTCHPPADEPIVVTQRVSEPLTEREALEMVMRLERRFPDYSVAVEQLVEITVARKPQLENR